MKLIRFQHSEDFGHNVIISFGRFRNIILAQVSVYHSVFWKFPEMVEGTFILNKTESTLLESKVDDMVTKSVLLIPS